MSVLVLISPALFILYDFLIVVYIPISYVSKGSVFNTFELHATKSLYYATYTAYELFSYDRYGLLEATYSVYLIYLYAHDSYITQPTYVLVTLTGGFLFYCFLHTKLLFASIFIFFITTALFTRFYIRYLYKLIPDAIRYSTLNDISGIKRWVYFILVTLLLVSLVLMFYTIIAALILLSSIFISHYTILFLESSIYGTEYVEINYLVYNPHVLISVLSHTLIYELMLTKLTCYLVYINEVYVYLIWVYVLCTYTRGSVFFCYMHLTLSNLIFFLGRCRFNIFILHINHVYRQPNVIFILFLTLCLYTLLNTLAVKALLVYTYTIVIEIGYIYANMRFFYRPVSLALSAVFGFNPFVAALNCTYTLYFLTQELVILFLISYTYSYKYKICVNSVVYNKIWSFLKVLSIDCTYQLVVLLKKRIVFVTFESFLLVLGVISYLWPDCGYKPFLPKRTFSYIPKPHHYVFAAGTYTFSFCSKVTSVVYNLVYITADWLCMFDNFIRVPIYVYFVCLSILHYLGFITYFDTTRYTLTYLWFVIYDLFNTSICIGIGYFIVPVGVITTLIVFYYKRSLIYIKKQDFFFLNRNCNEFIFILTTVYFILLNYVIECSALVLYLLSINT